MAVKGKKKNILDTTASVINPTEFEGLVSFEEISSYSLKNFHCGTGKHKKFQILQIKDEPAVNKKKKKKNILEETEKDEDINVKSKKDKRKKNNSDKQKKNPDEVKLRSSKKRALEDEDKIINVKEPKKIKPTFNIKNDKSTDVIDVLEWQSIYTPKPILEAIVELGFKNPTEIQRLTIPAAIKDRKDIVGAAETGSGKTLAFGIPIISGILNDMKEEEAKDNIMDGIDDSGSEDCLEEVEDEAGGDLVEDLGMMEVEDSCFEEGDSEDSNCEDDIPILNKEGIGCVKVIDGAKIKNDDLALNKVRNVKPLRALIITPTRELAVQIKNHLDSILTKTTIRTCIVIGGMNQEKQERLLAKGPEIVIGTPGRLWEMIQQGNSHLGQIADIRYLAVDETDRMLEKDHFDELRNLFDLLPKKSKRQTFIFSATLTMIHAPPKRLLNSNKKLKCQTKDSKLTSLLRQAGVHKKPKIVDVTRSLGTAQTLSEARIYCDQDEKDLYLYYFVKMFPGRTLVFCNSINCVRRLANLFEILHCKPQSLYANKHQKQRLKALEKFASSSESLLLATDIAARGLDITGIDHIIHYEVPRTAEVYVHRSGRTARACQEGLSVIYVQPNEMSKFRALCKTLNRNMDLPPFPVDTSMLSEIRKRLDLAKSIEVCEFREKKKKLDNNWWKQMSQEAGIELDDDMSEDEATHIKMGNKKTSVQLKSFRQRLRDLISKPIVIRGMSTRYPTKTGKLEAPAKFNIGSAGSALALVKKENVPHDVAVKKFKVKLPKEKMSKKEKRQERRKKKREDDKFQNTIAIEEDKILERFEKGREIES